MKIDFTIHIHIYDTDTYNSGKIKEAVLMHNEAYVLQIVDHYKYASRWYFVVSGELPNNPNIVNLKYDTCHRLGGFMVE